MPESAAVDEPQASAEASAPRPEEDAHAELRARLREHERPSRLGLRTLVFVLSLGAFVWVMRDSGPLVVAVVVGVLALHEAGHFVAMRVLGYENLKVFFVPFLGAAVAGRASKPGGWRAGVVSLAGPVPGIVLGAALFAAAGNVPLVRVVVMALVFVNGLNLLPLLPLDGGRLMSTVLFSRHRLLELGGTFAGMAGLVVVPGLLPGMPAIWIGLFVGLVINRSRVILAAHRLRQLPLSLEGPTSELSAESLTALQGATAELLENRLTTKRGETTTLASLHEAAATRPAQWSHALALFVVYAAAGLLAASTYEAVKHPRAHWAVATGPQGAWRATFPAPPTLRTVASPAPGLTVRHEQSARLGGASFTLVSVVLDDVALDFDSEPEEAFARMKAMVEGTVASGSVRLEYQRQSVERGHAVLHVGYRGPNNEAIPARYETAGHTAYVLLAERATPEQARTFFEGFEPGP